MNRIIELNISIFSKILIKSFSAHFSYLPLYWLENSDLMLHYLANESHPIIVIKSLGTEQISF